MGPCSNCFTYMIIIELGFEWSRHARLFLLYRPLNNQSKFERFVVEIAKRFQTIILRNDIVFSFTAGTAANPSPAAVLVFWLIRQENASSKFRLWWSRHHGALAFIVGIWRALQLYTAAGDQISALARISSLSRATLVLYHCVK